jgi:hypothetical protein
MRKVFVFAVVMMTVVVGGAFLVVQGADCDQINACRQSCESKADEVRCVDAKRDSASLARRGFESSSGYSSRDLTNWTMQCQQLQRACANECGRCFQ